MAAGIFKNLDNQSKKENQLFSLPAEAR